MTSKEFTSSSSSSPGFTILLPATVGSGWVISGTGGLSAAIRHTRFSDEELENAIYTHLQAIRALGRETANSYEIAEALSVPMKEVERIMENLQDRGVTIAP